MLSSHELLELNIGVKATQEKLTLTRILEIVSNGRDLTTQELISKKRDRPLAFARQLFMYLSRKYTKYSLMEIGRYVNRDHCTVLHALKSIQNIIETEPKTRIIIEYYEREIQKCISMVEWLQTKEQNSL